jgi:hypothetical protein
MQKKLIQFATSVFAKHPRLMRFVFSMIALCPPLESRLRLMFYAYKKGKTISFPPKEIVLSPQANEIYQKLKREK